MEKETPTKVVSASREFTIPIGLLKAFQTDIRMKPVVDHTNGYIIFDMPMLISVLRGRDAERAKELASELEKMVKAGGELVVMQR
jgi:hypothetical protein